MSNLKNKIKNILHLSFFRGGNSVSYVQAKEMCKENPLGVIIDVRSIQEYKEYHLDGAICIPVYELEHKILHIIENKNQLIILYCQSGGRSRKGMDILRNIGYTNVYEIEGGLNSI